MWQDDVFELNRHRLETEILEDAFWQPELRAVLHELLVCVEQAGYKVNIHSLGLFLGDFVPSLPLERAEEWQVLALQRWLTQTKPELVERLAEYLIS
ncbi:MAG: hypothetical protein Q7J43_07195 [Pseudomonas sp.]|uniref:hypothetical protein n=1 Tax=Pseudomonas sp. TaxID=306 RepID=UPI0027210467|nr:hypothetical protein [Pseudomonas sp.]MDO9617454.1 hypothetical protein [Pseudomonas sp.]MDP2443915.1 hypothetical protein [Pseudomonas sp.]MDZ4333287.1 hypothetical protein [Pseudomonas sp.]